LPQTGLAGSCPRCGDEVFIAWQRGHPVALDVGPTAAGWVTVERDPDPDEHNPLLIVEPAPGNQRGPKYVPHACGLGRLGFRRPV